MSAMQSCSRITRAQDYYNAERSHGCGLVSDLLLAPLSGPDLCPRILRVPDP